MKIALSGSQNVGKTTLLNSLISELGRELPGCVFIKEIVRSLKKQDPRFKFNKIGDVYSQKRVLQAHINNRIKYECFITDRCSLDAFVYALWNYLNGDFNQSDFKIFEEMFLDNIYHYDKIFYIPPSKEIFLVDDKVRDVDPSYQYQIHYLFKYVISKYKLDRVLEIEDWDLSKRIHFIKSNL